MFEFARFRLDAPHDLRVVVGVASLLYVTALAVFLVVGPFLVSGAFGLPLGAAFETVVGIVGVGYAIAGALLLR
jgi:hypothetical protein